MLAYEAPECLANVSVPVSGMSGATKAPCLARRDVRLLHTKGQRSTSQKTHKTSRHYTYLQRSERERKAKIASEDSDNQNLLAYVTVLEKRGMDKLKKKAFGIHLGRLGTWKVERRSNQQVP